MATYAVEVVITVEADSEDEAYEKATAPLDGLVWSTFDDCLTKGEDY